MNQPASWTVSFHDDFDAEFDAFTTDVQDELLAAATVLKRFGPAADRPLVGTLNNTAPYMKELRFKANHGAEVWRAAFAFDPHREAVILIAAAKQGVDEAKFYKDLLKKANKRFEQHLVRLAAHERSRKRT